MEIGFVGLGQMGAPMVSNLASKFSVTVFDQNKQHQDAFAERGYSVAKGSQEVATADIVYLCLPDSYVVETVLFGEDGMAAALRSGTVVVDTSTIDYAATVSISKRLAERGVELIDAPVSGMQARAEDGTLTMMCGGKEKIVENLRPQFSTMASNILFMGPTGSGQLTKLINQLLFDINAAALAEILPLAVKLGLSPSSIGGVVNSGTGRSYASEFFIPNILEGEFARGYPMAAAYKDLVSGSEISARHQIPTPVLAAATSTYQQALLAGHGDKDKGGMICLFEDLLGVTFRADANGGKKS